jgi:hypothetical protein
MKRPTLKLKVRRETLRRLDGVALRFVDGGGDSGNAGTGCPNGQQFADSAGAATGCPNGQQFADSAGPATGCRVQ